MPEHHAQDGHDHQRRAETAGHRDAVHARMLRPAVPTSSPGREAALGGDFRRPMIGSPAMSPIGSRRGRSYPVRLALAWLAAAALLAGCQVIATASPAPTPADFPGIATAFVSRGLRLDHLVSGDAGCPDATLIPTSIGFDASGLDQSSVLRLHIYIFADRSSYERLRSTVDSCARSYVTDPDTFVSVEQSPFVIAAQGPWAPKFEAALRAGLAAAAGSGG